jgi:hypothetical protein
MCSAYSTGSIIAFLFTFIYFTFVASIRVLRYMCPCYLRIFYLITLSITDPPEFQTFGIFQTLLPRESVVGKKCVELCFTAKDTRSTPEYGCFLVRITEHNKRQTRDNTEVFINLYCTFQLVCRYKLYFRLLITQRVAGCYCVIDKWRYTLET